MYFKIQTSRDKLLPHVLFHLTVLSDFLVILTTIFGETCDYRAEKNPKTQIVHIVVVAVVKENTVFPAALANNVSQDRNRCLLLIVA